jgi:hypothetical protein
MFEMYCKNLPLSKDFDPQESMHGEELLSITCNILVQVYQISFVIFFSPHIVKNYFEDILLLSYHSFDFVLFPVYI